MKILIETIHSPYSADRVGGAEISLRLIAEKMVENDHSVYFITKQQSKTLFGYSRKKINGVQVITYSKFKLNLLNRYRVKQIFQSIKAKHQRFFIKKNKIQIVHTYYNYSLLSKYVHLKRELGFKLIIRLAGLKLFEEIKERGEERKEQYRALFNEVDKFNFLSKGFYELFHLKMEEYNFDYRFTSYFINDIGVNLSENLHRNSYSISKTKFNIVMVSRLSKYQKRQDILINAIAILKNDNIHLTIMGEGPNEKELREQVDSLNLNNSISFKPFIKQENLWENLIEFDLLVHACEYEGLSKIILESMANGLPVLASNVLPVNTCIDHENNGFLVKNDANAWADKIAYLYWNQSLFPNVVKNANNFILKNYNAKENFLIYENYFQVTLN